MSTLENELIFLLHVVIAAILTGVIGYERGDIHKPAGVRTNMIVGGAVCMLVLLGEVIFIHYLSLGHDDIITADPTRILQAIVVGISFIGAGIVLHDKKEEEVKYLTSSATILFSTGIGISVALKQYIFAIGVTIFVLVINRLLAHTWIKKKEDL